MQIKEAPMIDHSFSETLKPVYIATAMTLAAEAVYLVVWGLFLFPEGSFFGKLLWTLTCGLVMGIVIGVTTILLLAIQKHFITRFLSAALSMSLLGSYCAFLCGKIDMNYNYFGGSENPELFLMSGVIPSVFGGLLYGWILYRLET